MKKLFFILVCVFASFSLFSEETKGVVINNSVLARVHGKTITLLDVVKKMDVVMMRYYPDQFSSSVARTSFYRSHWKSMLIELIDRELVLQAAEEVNFPVSQGDVRQELEEMFGPNIMLNIERAGLTYSEAFDMVKTDITIRRMLMWQVSSQVQAEMGPEALRKRYEEYTGDSSSRAQYTYRMCTFRGEDLEAAKKIASDARAMFLNGAGKDQKTLEESLRTKLSEAKVSVSFSDAITQNVNDMSEAVYYSLEKLAPNDVSAPTVQQGRSEMKPFVRMYLLEKKEEASPRPFEEVAEDIKKELYDERYAALSEKYFSKLRRDYHVDMDAIFTSLSTEFQPFGM